jgi:hypothetical protein
VHIKKPQDPQRGLALFKRRANADGISISGYQLWTDSDVEEIVATLGLKLKRLRIRDNQPITAAGYRHLSKVPALHELQIGYTYKPFDNDCLAAISEIPHLETLRLCTLNTNAEELTAAGLAPITAMPTLQCLCLWNGMPATDDTLARLARRKDGLRALEFEGKKEVTVAGWAHLPQIAGLQVLLIRDDPAVNAEVLSHVKDIAALRDFSCHSCTSVNDAAVAHLRMVCTLERLDLTFCGEHVTDLSLLYARDMTALKELIICGCAFTSTGVAQLRADRPDLKIDAEFSWRPRLPILNRVG